MFVGADVPDARIQMVSSVINNGGVRRGSEFSRTDEYLFFVLLGNASPKRIPLDKEWFGNVKNTNRNKLRWREFKRSGSHNLRKERPNQFYPIFVSTMVERLFRLVKVIMEEIIEKLLPQKAQSLFGHYFLMVRLKGVGYINSLDLNIY